MKKIIILSILLQNFLVTAQEPPKMQKYIAKNAANIFYYNLAEVVEKVKIKKDEIGNTTKKELRIYNDKVKDISFLNFQKLQELDFVVNSMGEKASSDRDLAIKIRKQITDTILPIRDSIEKNEKELNKNLKNILSAKQFKKFKKYQKNKKKSLLPKPPKSNNNQMASPMRNGNGRGRGRGAGRGGF
jgi:hypothetical protein